MKRVVIESPYGHPDPQCVADNVAYAERCVMDCLRRGESPYASHLFFIRAGLLDDTKPEERALGIQAGLDWGRSAELVAVYVDRGISDGMLQGIKAARERGTPLAVRALDREMTDQDVEAAIGSSTDPEPMPGWRLWVDIETTGLDPVKSIILEIAWILTRYTYPYEEICEGSRIVSSLRAETLRKTLDPFLLDMHEKSGLLTAIEERDRRLGEIDSVFLDPANLDVGLGAAVMKVEQELLFLSQDWPLEKDRKVVLAGNSVDFDRGFLRKHMPEFAKRLSHRVSDASSYYRFCRDLGMPRRPKPENAHRAAVDVRESLELQRACAIWVMEKEA